MSRVRQLIAKKRDPVFVVQIGTSQRLCTSNAPCHKPARRSELTASRSNSRLFGSHDYPRADLVHELDAAVI